MVVGERRAGDGGDGGSGGSGEKTDRRVVLILVLKRDVGSSGETKMYFWQISIHVDAD